MKKPAPVPGINFLLFAVFLLLAAGLSSCTCPVPNDRVSREAACLRPSFKEEPVTIGDRSFPLDTIGPADGRPVLLLHELNGQSPGCLGLAKQLADRGCRVYVPRFYASFGSDINPGPTWLRVSLSPCWALFQEEGGTALRDSEKFADLVRDRHRGRKVTVIGNCMTAGHALVLLARPEVETAVVCQPAAPVFPFRASACRALGVPAARVTEAIAALRADGRKKILSFHYLHDPAAPIQRTYHLAGLVRKAGAGDRHFLRIGAPDPPPRLPELEGSRYRLIRTSSRWGHPTVTSAKGPDLDRYRTELYQLLGLPAEMP